LSLGSSCTLQLARRLSCRSWAGRLGNLTLRGLGLDSRNLERNRNLKRNRLRKVFLVPVRVQAWVSGTLLVGTGEGMEQAEDGQHGGQGENTSRD